LYANDEKSFIGSYILSLGFTLSPLHAQELIKKNLKNEEVLFPYLNGHDLNTSPDQSPSRWVINFQDWSLQRAEEFIDCMSIVREKVKPERDKLKGRNPTADDRARRWWQFARQTAALYKSISQLNRVLVVAQTSKTLAFTFVTGNYVFALGTVVFPFQDACFFSLLQSCFHESWARKYASTLKEDLRYTPSDVFETFPFPKNLEGLEQIGETYHEHRRQIMQSRQEGLTATYNRFHIPEEGAGDIVRLRELHVEMDKAVASAYGWDDLALGHDFHETAQGVRFTVSESARREILSRLLKLNHERYEEEQKSAASVEGQTSKVKGGKGRKKTKSADDGQMGMF
jgi:hypothetical protein